MTTMQRFTYEHWRHGGWYVSEVRYPSGAVGCVSRNYADRKWRIACDPRPDGYSHTYKNRDEAAQAEYEIAQAMCAVAAKCETCGHYKARHNNIGGTEIFCGTMGCTHRGPASPEEIARYVEA